MAKKKRNANGPLIWGRLAIYGALLLLFGWQTWEFVNWLFPDDQLGAKVLTLISFDILALFWSLVHTFYSFKSPGALWWVRIAWGLTFVLSLVASVLNLTISFYFRFQLAVDPGAVKVGYAVSIIALVVNILSLMSWLILEYIARHPHQHEFDEDDDEQQPVPASQHTAQHTPTDQERVIAMLQSAVARIQDVQAQQASMPVPAPDTSVHIRPPARYNPLTGELVRSPQMSSPLAPAPSNQNGNGAKANNP